MYIFNRSKLSDSSSNQNKTATNRNRLTLSSRAGSLNPFFGPIPSFSPIIPQHISKPSPSIIHTPISYTETIPTTTIKTTSFTVPRTDSNFNPLTSVPQVQIVNKKPIKNVDPLPDQYFEQESDYFDKIDEVDIPSTAIKSFNKNSSNSLSQSSSSIKSFIFPNLETELRFKLPALTEQRYDVSTLKSFFLKNQPSTTTEGISLASLKKLLTSTEKSMSARLDAHNFEVQRQKILSFIISENQPSSFKAPSKTATNHDLNKSSASSSSSYVSSFSNNKFNNAFENMHEPLESTTLSISTTNTPHVRAQTSKTTKLLSSPRDHINFNNKLIRLTLSSNLNNQLPLKDMVEEIQLIRSRQPEIQSLRLKPIEPTTYSPQKPYRASVEASKKSNISSATHNTNDIFGDENKDDEIEDPDSVSIHSRRRPYVNDYISSTLQISTRFPTRNMTLTNANVSEIITTSQTPVTASGAKKTIAQNFTSRGLIFKEILNKTLESQVHSKPIVSPYISLETQRLTNAIRTTTPRTTNLEISRESTSMSPASTYRSYFHSTAASKNISTFLFPETSSTIKTMSETPVTPSALILNNVEQITSTTERSRGKYRPYSLSSQVPNSINENATPTTYSPRYRYNTRNNLMSDAYSTSTTSEPPVTKRKVIRLKSGLIPPQKPESIPTKPLDVTTYASSRRAFIDNNFIPSPTYDTADFRPIITKLNEFISKLSHSADIFAAAPRLSQETSSLNDQNNNKAESQFVSADELTEKPSIFSTRYSFNKSNNNNTSNNNNLSNFTESHETSTKKFRATVEMPEMKVPFKSDENESSSSYDEEENDELPFESDINAPLPSTFSTISETSTTVTQYETTTFPLMTLGSTEHNLEPSTSTTENPKSLIPPRATRVNNQLKSSIIASGLPRRNSNSASIKCNDASANAKCNEIPSRYKEIIFN